MNPMINSNGLSGTGAGRERERRDGVSGGTYVGVLECDVVLGAVGSLKHKRAVLRPVLARLRRLDVAVTESGDPDRHRRALIAVAAVSGEFAQVQRVLDSCERQVADEVEIELLSTRRRLIGPHDE
jgi:uncharacterized protein YlxP (DUF503 family)